MLSPEMWHYSCMNKTILFVPGFQEGCADRDYDTLMNRWRAMGYAVEFVPIQWHRTMQKQWLQTLHERYRQYDPAETILAGFSFGACIAFLATCERAPSELWLFSLSPSFAECAEYWSKRDWRVIGKRRLEYAKQVSLVAAAQRIACPVQIFVGSEEFIKWPEMKLVFDTAVQHIPTVHGTVVEGAGHAVDDPRYVAAVCDAIER